MGSLLRAALGPKKQGIPGQPGAMTMIRKLDCLILDHPVKESRGRVGISSETRPVYVQSIYVPSIWSRTGDTYSGTLWFR